MMELAPIAERVGPAGAERQDTSRHGRVAPRPRRAAAAA